MADTPTISVIIAAWRAGRVLPYAVASALGQLRVRVEVIIVDDASPDDSFACAERLAADPRVRAFRMDKNAGPAAARNLALSHVRAPWVAVLDADDLMRPDRLSRMFALAQSAPADVILGNLTEVIGQSDQPEDASFGQPFITSLTDPAPLDLRSYILGNFEGRGGRTYGYLKPLISSGFLSRHRIRYNESLRNGEDFHLVLSCFAAGARMWFSPVPDYLYFRHDASVSHRADPAHLECLAAADRAFAEGQGDPEIRAMMHRRVAQIENLCTTETVMAALRDRRATQALSALYHNPGATPRLVRQLSQALSKRL